MTGRAVQRSMALRACLAVLFLGLLPAFSVADPARAASASANRPRPSSRS